jgi:opacity protein-like surface antigen
MKNTLATLLTLAFAASPALADFTLDAESGAVWAGKSDVRIPNDDGTFLSLTDDLAADDPQAYIRLRATWEINDRHEISGLYAPLSFDFSGEFDRDVDFDGKTFAAGVPASAKFKFNSYRLTYRYNFVRSETFTFGMGLTAKVRDAKVEITEGSHTERYSDLGVVPLINFKADWRFAPQWHLVCEGDALGASQGYAIDVGTGLLYDATENIGIRLGYRILDGGADNDKVYTMSTFHYATLGVTYRF